MANEDANAELAAFLGDVYVLGNLRRSQVLGVEERETKTFNRVGKVLVERLECIRQYL
jgi:hypothetical protein